MRRFQSEESLEPRREPLKTEPKTAEPKTATVPRVGGARPAMMRIRVDLPAPLSPRIRKRRPGANDAVTSRSAAITPNCLVTRRNSIAKGDGWFESAEFRRETATAKNRFRQSPRATAGWLARALSDQSADLPAHILKRT